MKEFYLIGIIFLIISAIAGVIGIAIYFKIKEKHDCSRTFK